MASLSYDAAPYEVRDDLTAAHRRAWDRLGRPGTWLDAEQRVAVAAEARHAKACPLCVERKRALSPYSVDGRHDSLDALPETWIEVIHRIVSDPGRLTRGWYRSMIESGVAETAYVEIVSIVAHVTAIDTFARGLGMDIQPLPAPHRATSPPRPGGTRHRRPTSPTRITVPTMRTCSGRCPPPTSAARSRWCPTRRGASSTW